MLRLHNVPLYAVGRTTAVKVQAQIRGCEACTEDAKYPLYCVLDGVTGLCSSKLDAVLPEYVLPQPLECPKCSASITERMFVDLAD